MSDWSVIGKIQFFIQVFFRVFISFTQWLLIRFSSVIGATRRGCDSRSRAQLCLNYSAI